MDEVELRRDRPLVTTRRHTSAFPRHERARVMRQRAPPEMRGRRECRMQAAPMAGLQQKKQAAVTTGKAGTTGIPCAMVLTAASCSPWSARLDSLHRLWTRHPRAWSQRRGIRTTRLGRPRMRRSSCDPSASIESPPRVRDDAFAPLIEAGWEGEKHRFRKNGRGNFFGEGLERAEEIEGAGEISRLAQKILIEREGGGVVIAGATVSVALYPDAPRDFDDSGEKRQEMPANVTAKARAMAKAARMVEGTR